MIPAFTRSPNTRQRQGDGLTERQKQVVIGIAEGKKYNVIAEELGISRKSVEQHRLKAGRKIGANGLVMIARWAIREGLVSA